MKYSNGSKVTNIDDMRPHMIIQGRTAIHVIPVAVFRAVRQGQMLISDVDDIDDFMPQIIAEWLEKLCI